MIEIVDVDAIHAEALREHLLSNPALYENTEDFLTMRRFLDSYKTSTPIVNNSYVYVSVITLTAAKYINIAHFDIERKLVKLDNNYAYFDINGTIKRFPETSSSQVDSMSEIYFFDSSNDFAHVNLLLNTKFSDCKITYKVLDKQSTENIKRLKELAGLTK